MANPADEQIKKVQIEGIEKPEDAASSTGTELDKTQLDKVSGGGGYYTDDSSGT
jgi:hypothetical protein